MYSEALVALAGSESGKRSAEEPPSWISRMVSRRKKSSATRSPAGVSSAMAAAVTADWKRRQGKRVKQPETLPVACFLNKEGMKQNESNNKNIIHF